MCRAGRRGNSGHLVSVHLVLGRVMAEGGHARLMRTMTITITESKLRVPAGTETSLCPGLWTPNPESSLNRSGGKAGLLAMSCIFYLVLWWTWSGPWFPSLMEQGCQVAQSGCKDRVRIEVSREWPLPPTPLLSQAVLGWRQIPETRGQEDGVHAMWAADRAPALPLPPGLGPGQTSVVPGSSA